MHHRSVRTGICLLSALTLGGALAASAGSGAAAATSTACDGGGFTLRLPDGSAVAAGADDDLRTTIDASRLGPSFLVDGRYVEFTVDAASFGLTDWTLTGAANPLDITGGHRTVVFAAKTPDHRGLTLTGDAAVDLGGEDLVLERSGPGLDMKIQAKDCAQGGVFQMEVERGDGTATTVTHVLGDGVFYFDNPNFREREGDVVPYKDTTVTVTNRINFANDLSADLVGRDSPQVASRIAEPACANVFPNRPEIGGTDTVLHCGGVSRWSVASGGRMGQVMGEDATEVAPPATACTQNCQAQNQVRGQAVNLGFPFPVPAESRLQPRFP